MSKKNKWPLGITLTYSIFVLALAGFAVFASINQVNLVSDNYYREGIDYQQQIERAERASETGSQVTWKFLDNKNNLLLSFPKDSTGSSISGNIMLFRPSDAAQDKVVPLAVSKNNDQLVSLKNLSSGYWRIKLFWSIHEFKFS